VSGNSAFGKALNIFNRYVRENYPVFNADLAWKYDHTLRVVSICSQLLKQAVSVFCGTGGEEILLGAALFHDIGRFVQFSKDNAGKKTCPAACGQAGFRNLWGSGCIHFHAVLRTGMLRYGECVM